MEVYISEVGLDVVALCGVQVELGYVLSQLVDDFKGHVQLWGQLGWVLFFCWQERVLW